MIEIVPPHRYPAFRSELLDMHRLRHKVFKERMGWDVPTRDDMEIDAFDELGPTYILAFDDDETVVGSWRLLPTTGPTMIADVFPDLLDGQEMPHSPDVWEVSRFALDCGTGQAGSLCTHNRITSEMFCGLVEFCLTEGVSEIISVYDILIARMLPRIGCLPHWQGRFQRIGKTKAVAGRFYATWELLEEIREHGEIAGPVTDAARFHVNTDRPTPYHVVGAHHA